MGRFARRSTVASRTWSLSTSPTPIWWDTPAACQRPSKPVKPVRYRSAKQGLAVLRSTAYMFAVDTCLGNLLEAVKRQSGVVLVTADHGTCMRTRLPFAAPITLKLKPPNICRVQGNCEKMWNESDDCPHTAHTLNKVESA